MIIDKEIEELKTLKDLPKVKFYRGGVNWLKNDGAIASQILKEEAVKWVKMLENWDKNLSAFGIWVKCYECNNWFVMINASFFKRNKELDCPLCKRKIRFKHEMIGPFTNFETMKPQFAIKQFKHFFDLTEEDLE